MLFEAYLDDPLLREIYAYWRLKRASGRMPSRRQIDPAEMPRLLPHLVISDRVDGGQRFRYRLIGTAIARTLGFDPTGRRVDDAASGRYRDYIVGLHQSVCEARVPLFAASPFPGRTRSRHHIARLLALPLSEDGRTVNQILSLMVFGFAANQPPVTVFDRPAAEAAD